MTVPVRVEGPDRLVLVRPGRRLFILALTTAAEHRTLQLGVGRLADYFRQFGVARRRLMVVGAEDVRKAVPIFRRSAYREEGTCLSSELWHGGEIGGSWL